MITIKPGCKGAITITNQQTRENLLEKIREYINTTGPGVAGIVIHNNTKTATVTYSVTNGHLHINVTNTEQDEIFRLKNS